MVWDGFGFFGLHLAPFGLILLGLLVVLGLDLAGFQLLLEFLGCISISLVVASLHFYNILTSFAILSKSEGVFGHVPGWVESHAHS